MPFPFVAASLAMLALLIAFASAAPGLPWSGTFDDGHFAALATGGFAAAIALLVLAATTRRIEITHDAVRVRRGVFGLGFHSTIPVSDIAAVETAAPEAEETPPYYKVGFRMKDGTLRLVATRSKSEAAARALARALNLSILHRLD
jgi:hypothetical protein